MLADQYQTVIDSIDHRYASQSFKPKSLYSVVHEDKIKTQNFILSGKNYENSNFQLKEKTSFLNQSNILNKYNDDLSSIIDITHSTSRYKNLLNIRDCFYRNDVGNGNYISKLIASEQGAYSIFQSLAYDPEKNLLHAIRVNDTVTQHMVIESYLWNQQKELKRLYVSQPTNRIGHQAFAFQYINGNSYFWTRGGYDMEKQRSLYARRFQYDLGGSISDVKDFKIFNENYYNSLGHQTVAISPDSKIVVFSATRTETSSRVIRVYNLSTFVDLHDDYTEKYIFEFIIPKPYFFELQSLATDGNYIYTLDGNNNYANSGHVRVFTLDGEEVINDKCMRLGKMDAKSLSNTGDYNLFYEQEGLVILPTFKGYQLHFMNVAGKLIRNTSDKDYNKHINMLHVQR